MSNPSKRREAAAEDILARLGAHAAVEMNKKTIATALASAEAELLREMMEPKSEPVFTAMLLAAGEVPLEHENGGIEVAPFKIWKAMLRAFAKERGIVLQQTEGVDG